SLLAAGDLLAQGRDVIVFPEGTRSRDGSIGEFHAGAARLAAHAGAPLVPVGIGGTRDLLPVHGRLRPTRVTVRIGAPADAPAAAGSAGGVLAGIPRGRRRRVPARPDTPLWTDDPAAARQAVDALAAQPVPVPLSVPVPVPVRLPVPVPPVPVPPVPVPP